MQLFATMNMLKVLLLYVYEYSFNFHSFNNNSFQANDYIGMINVHFFIPKNYKFPCLAMHGGEGFIQSKGKQVSAGRRIARLGPSDYAWTTIKALLKEHEDILPVKEIVAEKENGDYGNTQSDSQMNSQIPQASTLKRPYEGLSQNILQASPKRICRSHST